MSRDIFSCALDAHREPQIPAEAALDPPGFGMLMAGARNGLHCTDAKLGTSLSPGKRGEDKDTGISSGVTDRGVLCGMGWHCHLSPGNPTSAQAEPREGGQLSVALG